MIFSEQTKELISSIIGPFEVVKDHRGNNDRTGVMEAAAGGARYFVKIHNRLSHWHPEVYAYKNWTTNMEGKAPKLVADFNEGNVFGIITTPVAGKTVNEMGMEDTDKLREVYYEAGRLLRNQQQGIRGEFFGIPKADGSPFEQSVTCSPVDYLCGSMERIYRNGYDKGLFNNAHKELLNWCISNSPVFAGDAPSPVNWDYSQNNWMVDETGRFTGFIDFESMLWGLPLDSFGVVIERYTFGKPYLRDALFQGYGLDNGEASKVKLRILSVKMALSDICNGYTNHHLRFFECGTRLMKHMLDEFPC